MTHHPAPLSQLLADMFSLFASASAQRDGLTLSRELTALMAASLREAMADAQALELSAARHASNVIDLSAIFAREQASRRRQPQDGGAA